MDARPFAGVTPADVAAARARYQLPRQFILTVGAHRPHKNHGILVRALAALPAAVSLVIVGYFDRSFPDPLPGLIARLGLESRIRLIPEVDDGLLPAVYRASSVFAFPSLAEGYGLPVLEALACGTPVVASDIPALAEVSGPAAVLIPPHDLAGWAGALGRVLADPATAARLAAAGPPVAAGAGWERGAAALSGVLSAVADRRPGARPGRRGAPGGRGSRPLRAAGPPGPRHGWLCRYISAAVIAPMAPGSSCPEFRSGMSSVENTQSPGNFTSSSCPGTCRARSRRYQEPEMPPPSGCCSGDPP